MREWGGRGVRASHHMSWSVDDVEVRAFPLAERGGGFDGDTLFALEFHAVHLCPDTVLAFHLQRKQ